MVVGKRLTEVVQLQKILDQIRTASYFCNRTNCGREEQGEQDSKEEQMQCYRAPPRLEDWRVWGQDPRKA
jgi:hypothetical protein